MTQRNPRDADFLGRTVGSTRGIHDVVVGRERNRIRLFASQPGLRKTEVVGREEGSVALSAHVNRLAVARGKGTPGLLVKEVLGAEVVEIQASSTDNHVCSPSALQLELAGGLLGYGILQVNRPRHWVGVGHNVNGPWVEVAKLSQFSNGSLNVCLREQVSRAGADFAVDYMVVGAVVAHHLNLAHRGRTPFANSNFEVNGVVGNPCFDRNYVAKEVAAVEVKRRNIVPVRVAVNPCCEQLRVVAIAGINS